jgi:hypothetical protein
MVRVFENWVLREICGSMREQVTGGGGNCIMGLRGDQKRNEERGEEYEGKTEMHAEFWWANLKEADHFKTSSTDVRIVVQ